MQTFIKFGLILIGGLHFYFLYLEMFQWTKPRGLKIFRQSFEQATNSKILASNQGLYNGFLASGLLWAAFERNLEFTKQLSLFFLTCVLLAGIFGGFSVHRRIFLVQGAPAMLLLLLLLIQ